MSAAPGGAAANPLRFVTDNLALKLTALLLAIGLFSLVKSDADAQRALFVDVVTLLPPASARKMLVSEVPHEVKVTLRGSRSRINQLSRDDLPPLQMDLTDMSRAYFQFDPGALDLGANVQVIAIEPAMVMLDWVTSAERSVAVLARLQGAPREGYRVRESPEVRPGRIGVRGPEEIVRDLGETETEAISVEGLGPGTHTRRVPLRPLPEHVSYVDEVAVEVRMQVDPIVSERTLRGLDVAIVGEGPAVPRPGRVAVTLRGPTDELEALTEADLVPYVELDVSRGVGRTRQEKVKLRGVPEGVEPIEITPDVVLVDRTGAPTQ